MYRSTLCVLTVVYTWICCTSAGAQITAVGPPGPIQGSAQGGVLDEVSLVMLDVTFNNADPLANVIEATLTGDLNFTPQEGQFDAGYNLQADFEITVGQFPVHLYNVVFIADGKLVNGGGTFDHPFTQLDLFAGLGQINPDIGITGVGVSRQLQGNGLVFVQGSPLMAPYILAAGETYRINMGMLLEVDTLGLFNDPVSVISHEFGGVSAFDGYKLHILAAAVPEPVSLALFAPGILMLGCRRVEARS